MHDGSVNTSPLFDLTVRAVLVDKAYSAKELGEASEIMLRMIAKHTTAPFRLARTYLRTFSPNE